MRRVLVILLLVALVMLVVLVVPFQGQRILGFRYSVILNNLDDVCPSRIVDIKGDVVTIDDGRSLRIEGPAREALLAEMKECEYRVRFNEREGALYTMHRIGISGTDRPETSQLVTLPVIRKVFPKYGSRLFSAARVVSATSRPATQRSP